MNALCKSLTAALQILETEREIWESRVCVCVKKEKEKKRQNNACFLPSLYFRAHLLLWLFELLYLCACVCVAFLMGTAWFCK